MNVRTFARNWCPPIVLRWARRFRARDRILHDSILFEGNYLSWAAAKQASTGYDAAAILRRVREAALKVKRGEAVFERDSVCFFHEEYRWATLACLLAIAAERSGRLNVVDFGGSLGSFYFQHKKFLSRLSSLRWAVVEQKHFVACGRDEIQDESLRFHESILDCLAYGPMDVVFLSGVLQVLERPYATLEMVADEKVPYLLIDRTPFIEGPQDRLTVQHVPASIYKASYPAWFFSRQKFKTAIQKAGYRTITEFPGEDDVGIGKFEGIFLERA